MIHDQFILDISEELIVDNFAGGGGASTGIELALGRHVDIAINHDPEAVAMHRANHPQTRHLTEDVFDVDPVAATKARRVGLAWFSPDCKHFSKAKGGKPREKRIRGLAWVMLGWVVRLRRAHGRGPRVLILENVEEFQTWCPLLRDGTPSEWRPGWLFQCFVGALRRRGYVVDWRELRACDYGAPTIRKRLFLIARCDGRPVIWPAPTHGAPDSAEVKAGRLQPWRTAAECIDWSIPCPSIFDRKRPLAPATCRRIARGIMRYVVNCADPFIVPLTHQGDQRTHGMGSPFPTVTGAHRGELALVAPVITEHANSSSPRCMPAAAPLRTQCAQVKGGHFALVSAFLAKHYGGHETPGIPLPVPAATVTTKDHHALVACQLVGCGGRAGQSRPRDAGEPVQTITAKADTALIVSHLAKFRGRPETHDPGKPMDQPLDTLSAQGNHFGEVRAFLIKYYGNEREGLSLREPSHTVTSRDRFGLVTVSGEEYAIADIGLRMLAPRELFQAQGFPGSYRIGDNPAEGLSLTKTAQVRMVGNSVCPPMARAIVVANVPEMGRWTAAEQAARPEAA